MAGTCGQEEGAGEGLDWGGPADRGGSGGIEGSGILGRCHVYVCGKLIPLDAPE